MDGAEPSNDFVYAIFSECNSAIWPVTLGSVGVTSSILLVADALSALAGMVKDNCTALLPPIQVACPVA